MRKHYVLVDRQPTTARDNGKKDAQNFGQSALINKLI